MVGQILPARGRQDLELIAHRDVNNLPGNCLR